MIYGLVYRVVEERYSVNSVKPVPLKSICTEVSIKGHVADVTSTLTYENKSKQTVEAAFVFPVDEQSAVYYFQAEIDGRVIVGECQTKEEAKQTYSDAIKSGHTAFLLSESQSSDIFRILVGNLPPNQFTKVTIAYVAELSVEVDGADKFILPRVLNPRYNPTTGYSHMDANLCSFPGPEAFDLEGSVDSCKRLIKEITSTTDGIKIQVSDDKNCAKFTTKPVGEKKKQKNKISGLLERFNIRSKRPPGIQHMSDIEKDVELRIVYQDSRTPVATYEAGLPSATGFMKQDAIMLNVVPEVVDESLSSAGEYIFIVDRSGSMSGSRMDRAKDTLLLFLKSLPVGCYFNVISFGSSFSFLFNGGSAPYTEENLQRACELQESMKANMGGTEILRPFQEVYSRNCKENHPRQIFILTDGGVGNTDDVIEIVKKNAWNTRVFAFGIGEGASTALVKGVARAGRGKCEFVKDSEQLQGKVMSVMRCARQGFVSDVSVDWDLPEQHQPVNIPKKVPPIFPGHRLTLFTLLKTPLQEGETGKMTLKWKEGETQRSHEVRVTRESTSDCSTIHRFAAKAKIHELQDDMKVLERYIYKEPDVVRDMDMTVPDQLPGLEDVGDLIGHSPPSPPTPPPLPGALPPGGCCPIGLPPCQRPPTPPTPASLPPVPTFRTNDTQEPDVSPQPQAIPPPPGPPPPLPPPPPPVVCPPPRPPPIPMVLRKETRREDNPEWVKVKEAVVLISISSNIVCKYTSFVAVDRESKVKVQDQVDLKSNTPDYTSASQRSYGVCPATCANGILPPPPPPSRLELDFTNLARLGPDLHHEILASADMCCGIDTHDTDSDGESSDNDDLWDECDGCIPPPPVPSALPAHGAVPLTGAGAAPLPRAMAAPRARAMPAPGATATPEKECKNVNADPLLRLIQLQKFDGRWEPSEALGKILGKSEKEIRDTSLFQNKEATGSLWATALALAWLAKNCPGRQVEWLMIQEKALEWMKGQSKALEGKTPEEIVKFAEKLM